MKGEHWKLEDGDVVFQSDSPHKDMIVKDNTYCCAIEGETWDEIMTKWHEHMGFEPYEPMP